MICPVCGKHYYGFKCNCSSDFSCDYVHHATLTEVGEKDIMTCPDYIAILQEKAKPIKPEPIKPEPVKPDTAPKSYGCLTVIVLIAAAVILFSSGILPSFEYVKLMAKHDIYYPPESEQVFDSSASRFVKQYDVTCLGEESYFELVDTIDKDGELAYICITRIYDVSHLNAQEKSKYFIDHIRPEVDYLNAVKCVYASGYKKDDKIIVEIEMERLLDYDVRLDMSVYARLSDYIGEFAAKQDPVPIEGMKKFLLDYNYVER